MKILSKVILIILLIGSAACVSTPYDYLRNRDYNGLKKEVLKNNNFIKRKECKRNQYYCINRQYFSVIDYLCMYTFTNKKTDNDLLKFLIENGAPITNKNFTKYYREPIYRALKSGKNELAKTLIEYNEQLDNANSSDKFDLNNVSYDGSTALTIIASRRDNKKMIEFLLTKGVYLNKANNYKMTPLDVALATPFNKNNIDVLLKHKAIYQTKKRLIFDFNYLNNLKVLVKYGINILTDNEYVHRSYNHKKISKVLKDYLEDINAELTIEGKDYFKKIHFILFMNNTKLIKRTINLCLEDNKECTNYLNSSTYFGFTPIVLAAVFNNYELIEYLLEKGANINKQNKFFLTPLHIMILMGDQKGIEVLLKHNADINIKDIKNNTASDLYKKIFNEDLSSVQKKLLDELLKEKEKDKDTNTTTPSKKD